MIRKVRHTFATISSHIKTSFGKVGSWCLNRIKFVTQLDGIFVGIGIRLFIESLLNAGFPIQSLAVWMLAASFALGVVLASLAQAYGIPVKHPLRVHFLMGIAQGVFVASLVLSKEIIDYEWRIFESIQ